MRFNEIQISKLDFFAVCIAWASFLICSTFANGLLPDPDFMAYREMYAIGGHGVITQLAGNLRFILTLPMGSIRSYLEASWFFSELIGLCHQLGFGYMGFRLAANITSTAVFIAALRILVVNARKEYRETILRQINPAASFYFIFFAAWLLAYDFFGIRIRAGLAIPFSVLSLALFIKGKSTGKLRYYIYSILAAFVSLNLHAFSAMILLYFLFLPLPFIALGRILREKNFPEGRYYALAAAVLVFLSLIILYLISLVAGYIRGENNVSHLNSARFAFYFYLPVLYVILNLSRLRLYGRRAAGRLTGNQASGGAYSLSFFECYNILVLLNYLCFAVSMAAFYFSGLLIGAGEAITRIYELFTPVFLVCILLYRDKIVYRFFCLMIIGQEFFFINALSGNHFLDLIKTVF